MLSAQAGPLTSVVLSIAMIAALALIWGGYRTIRGGDKRKGVLMFVCAAVALANVVIRSI